MVLEFGWFRCMDELLKLHKHGSLHHKSNLHLVNPILSPWIHHNLLITIWRQVLFKQDYWSQAGDKVYMTKNGVFGVISCKVRSLAVHAPALRSLLNLSCPEHQSLDSFCAERLDPLGSQDLILAFHRPFFLYLLD